MSVGVRYSFDQALSSAGARACQLFVIHKHANHGNGNSTRVASYYVLDGYTFQAPYLVDALLASSVRAPASSHPLF